MDPTPTAEKGTATTSWDFFISYTAADLSWAEWIAWQLESVGYRVLFQAWDFVPGSHWTTRMRDGVSGAERTIAVLSSAYLRSVFGEAEWEAAYRMDPRGFTRKLIPVRVENCDRPDILGGVVSFDLFDQPADDARSRLLRGIEEAVAGRAKPQAEPDYPGQTRPDGAKVQAPATVAARPPEQAVRTTPPVYPGSPDRNNVVGLVSMLCLVGTLLSAGKAFVDDSFVPAGLVAGGFVVVWVASALILAGLDGRRSA